RLFFNGSDRKPYTLSGFKSVQDNAGPDIWKDTTTLFTNVFAGHITQDQEASSDVVAAGILRIELLDFLKELTTLRAGGGTFAERLEATSKFGRFFWGSLWEVYGPSAMPSTDRYEREIPLYTTEGITDATITTHHFVTADKLSLSLLRFQRSPCDDVV